MPVFDFSHWTAEAGFYLEQSGPLIPVTVGIPETLRDFLKVNDFTVTPAIGGMALIDTGAYASAVDVGVFAKLGVPPIDRIDTHTPHGLSTSYVFPASISFPTLGLEHLPMQRAVGCSLQWSGENETETLMLLGRDLLQRFLMIYNGKQSSVTLAF